MTGEAAPTALYELHVEHGAKLVAFGGYMLPMNYGAGILAEHRHTRVGVSLFDISHMNRFRVSGTGLDAALESVCPADIQALAPGRLRYTVLTNDQGGIVDDLVVRRDGAGFEGIANAATRTKVLDWLQRRMGDSVEVAADERYALLALQGPQAADVLAAFNPDVASLRFMDTADLDLRGIGCTVARAGYTGEDGFEISVPTDQAAALARRLLADDRVRLAGLGARDGLRLEAGLCLYGHDIDDTTTPVAAGLEWVVARARRADGVRAGGFPGAGRILGELADGPARRRAGLAPEGRTPLRAGAALTDDAGIAVGHVTSGGFSPVLERPVAMGYVDSAATTAAAPMHADIRGRQVPVAMVPLPFVAHRYVR